MFTNRHTLAGINVLEDIATTRSARFCDANSHVSREMAEMRLPVRAYALVAQG